MNPHRILRRARKRGYLAWTERQQEKISLHRRRMINAAWQRAHRRAGRVALVAKEDSGERTVGPTAWHFALYFPTTDKDDVAAFKALLAKWIEGSVVDDLRVLREMADDVSELPTDIEEVRKLACVVEVHDL